MTVSATINKLKEKDFKFIELTSNLNKTKFFLYSFADDTIHYEGTKSNCEKILNHLK